MTVELVGRVMLRSSSEYVLVLNNVLYVSSMRMSLFSVTQFMKDGFSYIVNEI